MLESQVSFCHQSSPVSRKARTFALNIAGVKQKAVANCVWMLVVKIQGIERIY